jgi:DNA-binding NarL/FixJ family response regulator
LGTQAERTAVLFGPHPLLLDALEGILARIGVAVAGRTASPEEALALVERAQPDLFICEMEPTHGLEGLSLIRACRERQSTLRVLALGTSRDPRDAAAAAFAAGAGAYASKFARSDDVAATVRQVFEQTIFLANVDGENGGHTVQSTLSAEDGGVPLTRREREILVLTAQGHSNRELARLLWITEQTVKFHLSNIYSKLDVANRTEAARWAYQRGLVV